MKKFVSFLMALSLSASLSLSLIPANPTTVMNIPQTPSCEQIPPHEEVNLPSPQAELPDVIVDEH